MGTEREAYRFVLSDRRFQKPDRATKRRILELLGAVGGDWTEQTFDLVMTPADCELLTISNVDRHLDGLFLIEVKATRKAIGNVALNGFFFGTTARQFDLARHLPDRYRYAFVVLSSDNEYGSPFFVLLWPKEVDASIQVKRLQYQVNFRSDMTREPNSSVGPFMLTPELLRAAHADVDATAADGTT